MVVGVRESFVRELLSGFQDLQFTFRFRLIFCGFELYILYNKKEI
jgi:hypothetical protein